MAQSVHARLIIEVLGTPKEHVEQTINRYLDSFEKTHEFLKREVVPARPAEGQLFVTHAEIEVRFKDLAQLGAFCFDAMPSSVEILEPSELSMSNAALNDFFNDLQAKLHDVDMMVKALTAQNKNLDRNSTNIFYNFLLYLCNEKARTLAELSRHVGLKPDDLKPFLDQLVEQKQVVLEGDVYKKI